jgi:chromosome partitioning protein
VGKTTTAVHLSHGLALRGKRVLLVDCDTQAQAGVLLGTKASKGLAEVLDGMIQATDAIMEARPNLFLLSGGRKLAESKRRIAQKEIASERVLAEAITPIESRFDYVIMDSSPGWDSLTVNELFYANDVICPVSLEFLAVDGLAIFLEAVSGIQKYKPLVIKHIVPTFDDRRVKKSAEIKAQLNKHFSKRVTGSIRYSVRLSEAAGFGKTIFEHNPTDRAAEDYSALVEEVTLVKA